jgi:hypothetical protein
MGPKQTIAGLFKHLMVLGAKNGEEALLTSVHSPVENQFLLDLAAKESPQFEYIMLGAIGDSNNHKQWDWVDGSSFSSFTNWQPNKPGGPRKAAVLFMLRSKNGKWMNSYADEKYRRGSAVAICKFLVG